MKTTSGNKAAGFTLLEILIAVSIFGLIFSYVFSVLTTTLDTGRSAEEKMDVDRIGRFIIKRMTHDLTCASTFPLSKKGGFFGRSGNRDGKELDEVHFTSFTRLHFGNTPRIDQSEIGYYFDMDKYQGPVLMRRESEMPDGTVQTGGTAFEITQYVKEFKLLYLGNKTYQGWIKDWDSTNPTTEGFPKAVSIELTLTDGKRDYFYSTVVVLEVYGNV